MSYSQADREKVWPIVELLQSQGWSVWWDTRLRAGEQWDAVIERELQIARCVVVVWSPISVTRRWVRVEANFALNRENLVPILINGAEQPLAFSLVHAVDLGACAAEASSPAAQRLLDDVRAKLSTAPQAPNGNSLERSTIASYPTPALPAGRAAQDWAIIEHSTDARNFRDFLEEHPDGLTARLARRRLADLAQEAWAQCRISQDITALKRFCHLFFDSVHVESARAMLNLVRCPTTVVVDAKPPWPHRTRLAVLGIGIPDPNSIQETDSCIAGASNRLIRSFLAFDKNSQLIGSTSQARSYAITIERMGRLQRWVGGAGSRRAAIYNYATLTLSRIEDSQFKIGNCDFEVRTFRRGEALAAYDCLALLRSQGLPLGQIFIDDNQNNFSVELEPTAERDKISLSWIDLTGKVETEDQILGIGEWSIRFWNPCSLHLNRKSEMIEIDSAGRRVAINFRSRNSDPFFLGPLLVQLEMDTA